MVYSDVKKLGKISKLGFGAMRFPKIGSEIDQAQVDEMIKHAYDAGINYYDTAYVYGDGQSEVALGKALKRFPRESFLLADKFPYYNLTSKEERDEFFQTSLDRCGVEYFDTYLIHAVNATDFPMIAQYDVINWALDKKKQGKIRHLGFSMHDSNDLLLKMLALCDWDFVQIQYNYLDLDGEPGKAGYEELLRRNIPIVIMEPLKGGILSDLPEQISAPFTEIGGGNVSYAFRYLAEKPGIGIILSGMSTMAQTVDNCNIFSDIKPLTAKEHEAILQVAHNIKLLQKVPCTGCRYCMPCPMGIDIPANFKAWNTLAMKPRGNWISGTVIDYEEISKCVACGKCVGHCPQKLNVPQYLKQIIAEK